MGKRKNLRKKVLPFERGSSASPYVMGKRKNLRKKVLPFIYLK